LQFKKISISSHRKSEAEIIYQKYIEESSNLSLGISHKLHQEIKKILLEENQNSVNSEIFDKIVEEVEWSMADHLRRFIQKKSQIDEKKQISFHSCSDIEGIEFKDLP
jgi:hypothetical protein